MDLRLVRAEAVRGLLAVALGGVDLPDALDEFNDLFRGMGIDVTSVVVDDSRVAEALGAGTPTPEEADHLVAWADTLAHGNPDPEPVRGPASMLVPAVYLGRVRGLLSLRRHEEAGPDVPKDLVVTLGHGVGEAICHVERLVMTLRREREAVRLVERNRLARDLHDTVQRSLVEASLNLTTLLDDLDDSLRRELAPVLDALELAKRQVGTAVSGLTTGRPSDDLLVAVENLIRAFEKETTPTTVLHVSGSSPQVPPEHTACLVRLVEEALFNAKRHASASRIDVTVVFDEDAVTVSVVDDGRGTDERPRMTDSIGFGLEGRRRHVTELGGDFDVAPTEPTGFRVTARLPLP